MPEEDEEEGTRSMRWLRWKSRWGQVAGDKSLGRRVAGDESLWGGESLGTRVTGDAGDAGGESLSLQ